MSTEKQWFSSYSDGVPHTINPDTYLSLIDLFDMHSKDNADSVAFINMGATLTYTQLHDLSCNFGAYLQHKGLKKGSRVAIMMPNLLQYVVAMMGTLRAGMVVVNVNPLYTAPEVSYQLNDAGAEALVVLANFAATVQKALPEMPTVKEIIVTEIGDLMGFKGHLVNFAVKYIKRMVPRYLIPSAVSFHHVMDEGKKSGFEPVTIHMHDTAFLQYTGGTTGVPKGAMLTHRNMVSNVLQCAAWVGPMVTRNDIVIAALPMYHIFSLTVCCLTFISLGARCLLITNPRHMSSFLRIMKNTQVSVFVGLNTLFNGLMYQPKFKNIDFSRLKITIAGGMAMQSSVAERWHQMTGCPVTEGYGLTEASPVVTINPIIPHGGKFNGTIGLPIPSTDVAIRDDAGLDVAMGEAGELCVKGPQVMAGYWQRPDETVKVLDSAGWLKTGDIARMDQNGFFTIVDLKKDMILVSGFNVYPNELEEVLSRYPGVKEVAVIGVPCEKTGEAIKAFIVPDDGSVTEEALRKYCSENLTRYKIPKIIEFRAELPKSNVGKVLRRLLK